MYPVYSFPEYGVFHATTNKLLDCFRTSQIGSSMVREVGKLSKSRVVVSTLYLVFGWGNISKMYWGGYSTAHI